MCGRFTLTSPPEAAAQLFGYRDRPDFPPRYNIAPTQPVATVRHEHGQRRFALVRWGLIPGWVKDPASFTLLVNARAETAAEKPSFRAAMRHHRCLVPMDGFYEWRRTGGQKQPFFIRPAGGGLMAVAGLWDTWSDPSGGEIDTGALLTVPANRAMQAVHDRMPAILFEQDFNAWLDTGQVRAEEARRLLRPVADDYLEFIPVSSRVNSAAQDDPGLTERAAGAAPDAVSAKVPKTLSARRKAQEDGGNSGQLDLL
ncbi:SOS response-associated peptidase [Pannonibacter indicus]|uniref:SOS response-associated peptidase n=1 Tax=Pannonibacter indicus TaxID=466044 RepID=UPI00391CE354